MHIVITGGAGFVGGAVGDAAEAAGHTFSYFDKRDGNDIMGDLSALGDADAVIHLAGVLGTMELFDEVEKAALINVVGTARVADYCAVNGIQLTNILVPPVFPSIYRATKDGGKAIIDALVHSKGLRASHVIAYNAFGKGQKYGPGHPQKFAPTFSIHAWQGLPLPVWGDGSSLVDPTPIEVVARMLVDATGHGDGQVFDGGVGWTVTIAEIAEFINHHTGNEAGIEYLPMRIGETPTNIAATGQGWDRLDWDPRLSRAEVFAKLAETVDWYKGKTEVH